MLLNLASILAAIFGVANAPAPVAHGPAFGPAPFAVGDSAGNIPLDSPAVRILIRWVPTRSGVVRQFHTRIKLEGAACATDDEGYGAGDGGTLEAWTFRVRPDGQPTGRALRHVKVQPCALADSGTIALPLDLRVREGREYATVFRNAHEDAEGNYFSLNFLFSHAGLTGANSRNERRTNANDSFYGLDPRELAGYSTDEGRTWQLPGGPYGGRDGRAFLPSYLLEWRNGTYSGQPYYYSFEAGGESAMTFRAGSRAWTISALGAYVAEQSAARVDLHVDGQLQAQAVLRGDGHIRARIPPVTVPPGSTVTVVTEAGQGGLALRQLFADDLWETRLGLGPDYRYFADDGDPAPISFYPLPAPPTG
jgi:hypothetical protein